MSIELSSCERMSELSDYDRLNPLSYSHFNLKTKLNSSDDEFIVNTEYIPLKYFDVIKRSARTVTLTDRDLIEYKYQPKKYCYEILGNIELWSIVLRLNNMTSLTEFNKRTFKIPGNNILKILNEILILENDNITRNNMSIE